MKTYFFLPLFAITIGIFTSCNDAGDYHGEPLTVDGPVEYSELKGYPAETETPEKKFDKFTSDRLPFTINFMGEPKETITKEDTEIGEIEVVVYEYSPSPASSYGITLTEYPAQMFELYKADGLLEQTKETTLQQLKATGYDDEKITVDGRDGISFKIKGNYGGSELFGACYVLIDNNTIIITLYLNSKGWPDEKIIEGFLGSIKFKD